jgi:hypothetical protein
MENTKLTLTKRLTSFAKEAMRDNKAFSRIGQDDNSYDALALADIARLMVMGLEKGITPTDYPTYAGPSPDGMADLLEVPLSTGVAEAWLAMATEALETIA